eukprot:TRINITY_DN2976_c0_g1_i2.p1 TRINITY_DN2976_c0_g1~~TRINITY_DN2976_c0_g1_i2.p1  ORF type:complete len:346 (-),score=98.43 TRINITY_DN2976_c0_g1_i2:218-1255(-)
MMGTAAQQVVDFEVTSPPADGISSLRWSPKFNHLVATSWDNSVRVWEVNAQAKMTSLKAQTSLEAPVLCSSWSGDGKKVFTAGCDGKAKCWDLGSLSTVQVAQHGAPIKECFWVEQAQILATASWDKTLKYWDGRQSTPAITVNLPERAYAMDIQYPLAVVATAEKQILIFNLNSPQAPYKTIPTPLKHQTRVVSCFPSKTGFAVGSIEGRVALQHVDDSLQGDNFTFKCHRENTDLYAVNSIVFHPTYGTFATAGSDGTYNYWDKDSKQRLKQFPKGPNPIPCSAFNLDGSLYAYASSYDWSKGSDFYNPATSKNTIYLHNVIDSEIKPRPPSTTTSTARRGGR